LPIRPVQEGKVDSAGGRGGEVSDVHKLGQRVIVATIGAGAAVALVAAPAAASGWPRALAPGDRGRDVKRLQVGVAGWFPRSGAQEHFVLDGIYGAQTADAVRALQNHYGLTADGIAGRSTLRVLVRLTDRDGSTAHFDFSEFAQNRNPACSAAANAYAGTFAGGMVAPKRARRNVTRLMWRLEALRKRGRGHPIGVNSGFRSVSYNRCIGGAGASQHMYGTAADNRMADVRNRRERRLARRSELHGIGCYSALSHNHFDIRIDNPDLPSSRSWWWPARDDKGRDLDAGGGPCWGQRSKKRSLPPATTTAAVLRAVSDARPGSGALVPSVAEIDAFARAGEPADVGAAD
jgi:zinc D-Ala-D-Ala carboxypeptidase